MPSETTNEHEWTRIRRRKQRLLRSGDHSLLGELLRHARKWISGPSSLVFIRTFIQKLEPTCWSQPEKPVGVQLAAKPLFPGGVPEKACTTIHESFVFSRKVILQPGARSRSADFQSAVSPTSGRLGVQTFWRVRIENPRYGRLEVCATYVAAPPRCVLSWPFLRSIFARPPFGLICIDPRQNSLLPA